MELKVLSEGRRDRLAPALAQAIRQAQKAAESCSPAATPLAWDEASSVWSVAYALDGAFPHPDLQEFLGVLDRVRGHETGWPPWWAPTRPEIAPYPYDGIIECWMRESRFDGHSDFWRGSPAGKLFLLRSYRKTSRAVSGPERHL